VAGRVATLAGELVRMTSLELNLLLGTIHGLQTHIWFLHAQFLTLLVGCGALVYQNRKNGKNGRK
jgi:hypothetical protein